MNDKLNQAPASIAGTKGFPNKGLSSQDQERIQRLAKNVKVRKTVVSAVIPARTGKGFLVNSGNIIRILCVEGPQVADLNAFNADDPNENFWSGRTRVVHGGHLNVGDRLWSVPPKSRPMLTLIADTLEHPDHPTGARSHDLLFCRCDSRMYATVHGIENAANCNDNLASAISEFGLGPEHVHDPFNIFMTTGLNSDGRPFYLPSDSKKGDFVEMVAEMNCIVAISACPGGSSGPKSNSLRVEIYDPS